MESSHALMPAMSQTRTQQPSAPAESGASLAAAAAALRARRYAEAAAAARRALTAAPDDADARHLLAQALLATRKPEEALPEARAAVVAAPGVPGFHVTLGRVYAALHRASDAEAHFREATLLDPGEGEATTRLAQLLRRRRRHREAADVFRRYLAVRPDSEKGLIGLGNALRAAKQGAGAEEAYRKAVDLNPRSAFARNALAMALYDSKRPEDALPHAREAVRLDDGLVEARITLARCLAALKRWEPAVTQFRLALDRRTDDMSVWTGYAGVLHDSGRLDEATEAYETGLARKGDYLPLLINFANLLKSRGKHDRAEALYRKAIEVAPKFAPTYNNLAVLLKDQGRADTALELFEQCQALDPDFVEGASNLLFSMHYTPAKSPEEIARAHREWARRHADDLTRAAEPHGNDPAPDRPLRIGYVSPDFKSHSVAFFIEPVLEAHDRTRVEVYAYANQRGGDAVTARLRAHADHWREIARLDDAAAAGLIRADGIDLLIDLAGHTARNRMPLFARKPAPVQMTWLGYPNGTGMDAIDYRITDARADPPGLTEGYHAEKLIRLDTGFLCYRPPAGAPPVAPPPSAKTGSVTFASFNNLAKIGPVLVARWAEILKAVPEARMIVKAPPLIDPGPRAHVLSMFARAGVGEDRLLLVGRLPDIEQHLAFYEQVDIALDSFPYNGTTITCEALWMGVPTIVVAGDAHVSRVGASLCGTVGATELIARDEDDYVAKAIALAKDPDALLGWRKKLREMMTASPLLDPVAFTRTLEAAYREAWQTWCRDPS